MYQSIPKPPIPPPRAIPGRLTRVKLRTLGNLTQNEVRLVGHLTFVSKRLSAVGSKRISQFFDSAGEPRPRVIALVHSTWVFLLLSFSIVLSWNMPLFKVWSEDKLNKKFVVAENFAELVSTVCVTCLEGGGFGNQIIIKKGIDHDLLSIFGWRSIFVYLLFSEIRTTFPCSYKL